MTSRLTLLGMLGIASILGVHGLAAGQEKTISLELNAAPLTEALNRLQDASGLHLAFAEDLVRDAQPVTLSARDEPVDSVLLRVLRPRGLECIYTGETMAAIVRAATDEGMAKAAGRALRTFARLEKKLEGAVQEADEVRVPGWEEEDDRALAEGLVDLMSAIYFTDHHQRTSRSLVSGFPKMLNGFDRDVRVGCIIAAIDGGWRLDMNDDGLWLRETVQKMSADADPGTRAIGAFLWRWLRPALNQRIRTAPPGQGIVSASARSRRSSNRASGRARRTPKSWQAASW